jgi:hypothetical protein
VSDSRRIGAWAELLHDAFDGTERRGRAEGDYRAAALQLAEEEDVVNQLAHLQHLATGLLDDRVDVCAGQASAVEQHHQPCQRRSQLV